MNELREAFVARGFDVVNWDYLSTRHTIEESAEALHECYALNERVHPRVHFVTHSLGGVVLRCMLKFHPTPKLGKIVMLGPPNQGSAAARAVLNGPLKWVAGSAGQELKSKEAVAELCAIPKGDTLIVAGTKSFNLANPSSYMSEFTLGGANDGVVAVEETRLEGLPEPMLVDESHPGLTSNPEVIQAALAFILERDQSGAEKSTFRRGLEVLQLDPKRVKEIVDHLSEHPNLRMKTLGGEAYWADLANVSGWRVQENILFGNCRILNENNVRLAWGGKKDMLNAFESLVADVSAIAREPSLTSVPTD
jgi:hypothetical protein